MPLSGVTRGRTSSVAASVRELGYDGALSREELLMGRIHPIVIGGLAVGVLDILAAFAVRAAFTGTWRPMLLLQGIASGLLGPSAFRGGVKTAALGLLLHFFIAFVAAGVYYVASRRLSLLVRRPIVSGLTYGVIVYVVMNQVVLPLSRVAPRTPRPSVAATLILVHMLFVGLPIALAAWWAEPAERITA